MKKNTQSHFLKVSKLNSLKTKIYTNATLVGRQLAISSRGIEISKLTFAAKH